MKKAISLIIFMLFTIVITNLAYAQTLTTGLAHCDISGPWGWRDPTSLCQEDTEIQNGNCPTGSFSYQVLPGVTGCYYLGSNPICKAAYPKITGADECCFYTCKSTPLVISDVTTNPGLPLSTDKTNQNIQINFISNRYPLVAEVILNKNSQILDSKLISIASSTNLPLSYTLPSNLSPNSYELSLKLTDKYNNTKSIVLGEINLLQKSDTTPPASITGLELMNKKANELVWSWVNPVDPDFSKVIIYINGNKLKETSEHYLTLTNLIPNTNYTIAIQTMDLSGNINPQLVSDTQRTLSSNPSTPQLLIISVLSPYNITYNYSEISLNILTQNAKETLYILDNTAPVYYTQTKTLNFTEGQHNLTVIANNQDGQSRKEVLFYVNLSKNTTQPDLTAPETIKNLKISSKTQTSLTWKWTNPSDSDFAYALVYLNNEYVGETTNNFYTARSLKPNREYTITIQTKDYTGNINTNNVSNTAKTLSKNRDSDTGSNVDNFPSIEDRLNSQADYEYTPTQTNKNSTEDNKPVKLTANTTKTIQSSKINWLAIFLISDIIILIIILMFVIVQNSKNN